MTDRSEKQLKLSQEYAEQARLWMVAPEEDFSDNQAYLFAIRAARAAFRADPSLRGPKEPE
jgi:hypothetical protein